MVKKKKIIINNSMSSGYYYLTEEIGKNFNADFKPQLTPKEMLELGVFGGKYINDSKDEYPKEWFENAKLSEKKDISINYFKVDASQSLKEWERKGWIRIQDPRGWFQWYCRYYYGRRDEEYDLWQIKRWKGMRRHVGAIVKNCEPMDNECRKKQRQALLHWAYDSRNI